ncbi:MAG TPA: hypothetical protein VMJ10_21055 [Kofleriaceae bacterium]|nr:hypothetical protein [Kofleriaceae bacterium]
MRAALLVAGVVGGCGHVGFDPLVGGGPGDGGTGDGSGSGTCAMPSTFDSFAPGGNICGTWGGATNMGDSSRMNGLHLIVPPGHNNYASNCVDNSLSFANGTFASISAVTTLATGFVQLAVETTAGDEATMNYYTDTSSIEFGDGNTRNTFGEVTYDPVAMRWWRLYPMSAHEIAGQTSPDGLTWTTMGVDDVGSDSLATVKLVIGGGYYGAESQQSTTVFDSWNVCP